MVCAAGSQRPYRRVVPVSFPWKQGLVFVLWNADWLPHCRLRFSFVNVGPPGGPPRDENAPKVNTGRAPILASAFSDVFTVYSAKKFPGVCESTPLSKKFATQGIKIPIRKDGNMKGDGDDDEY